MTFKSPSKYIFLSVVIQDSCARVLLFRGANKEIKNYNSQTAFQVGLVSKNHCMLLCVLSYPYLTLHLWHVKLKGLNHFFPQPNAATLNMFIAIKYLSSIMAPTPAGLPFWFVSEVNLSGWWSPCEIDTVTDFLCRSKLICLYTTQAGVQWPEHCTHTDFTHPPQQRTKGLKHLLGQWVR